MGSGNVVRKLRRVDSVAIVGASPVEGRIGFELLKNVVKFGFEGTVYPVNPKYSEVLGLRCYATVRDVPDKVDVGIIAIPAPQVPGVVRDLCRKDAEVSVVISSGFGERGRRDLEEELKLGASDCGMRLIGPNSAGITSTPARLHASIEVLPTPGRVAVVSQSGAVGGVAMHELRRLGSGVSYFVSVGNSADVGVEEVLEGLAEDPFTDSALLYVEWVGDGRRFRRSLQDLARAKPVVVVKGGWGEVSSRAVASHTGGMAVPYEVFKAAVWQSGAVLAEEVEEAVPILELLRRFRSEREVSRVLLVTNSGGYGILAASHLEGAGVGLPQLDEELKRRVESEVGKEFSGSNPVDFGGDARSADLVKALGVETLDRYYDAAVLVYVPTSAESPREICESFRRATERVPVVYSIAGGGANWVVRCLSEAKPAVVGVSLLPKFFTALNRRARREAREAARRD